MDPLASVAAASAAFVATHLALSHPLRQPLVRLMGPGAFQGAYSVVALACLAWIYFAYRAAPQTDWLWPVGDVLWAIVTLLMLAASVLLLGSVVRNPALLGAAPQSAGLATPRGVFAITRHPMMWSFALWGMCHIAVFPVAKNIIVCGAIIVLALAGSALQDLKKARAQPQSWPAWEAKTSYFPFAAIAAGRAQFGGFGLHSLLGGLVVWLGATWAHIPLSGWPAGIWRWL